MAKNNNASAASLEAAARLNNQEVTEREEVRSSLAEYYKGEKKVTVMGAPMYRPFFGNSMPISINGILVTAPLDGQRYAIPESYAQIFNARINSINEDMEAQKRMSNVTSNHEAFPGELNLIRPV